MNPIFLLAFSLIFFVSALKDRKHLKPLERSTKFIYGGFALANICLCAFLWMKIRIPMPTQWLSYSVSPWIKAFLESSG